MGTSLTPPEAAESVRQGLLPIDRLQVPLYLALGRYERLTDEELVDHHADIMVEIRRRNDERNA